MDPTSSSLFPGFQAAYGRDHEFKSLWSTDFVFVFLFSSINEPECTDGGHDRGPVAGIEPTTHNFEASARPMSHEHGPRDSKRKLSWSIWHNYLSAGKLNMRTQRIWSWFIQNLNSPLQTYSDWETNAFKFKSNLNQFEFFFKRDQMRFYQLLKC